MAIVNSSPSMRMYSSGGILAAWII